jgi:tetratricopeptide (TPR) repeat protein
MAIKNDLEVIKLTNSSLDLLKSGKFDEALDSFGRVLKSNYSNNIAESGIKYAKYWTSRIAKNNSINDPFKKGKSLFDEWFKFEIFAGSIKNTNAKVLSCLMYYIFNAALHEFTKSKAENKIFDLDTAYHIGLCHKKIGNYNDAIKHFEESLGFESDNSNVMCQLADCFALIDEKKKAKILFREAFFIDPSSVDLYLLDSNIINYLVTEIKEYKVPEDEIKYWIPVYGRILGIFTVFRELLPIEAAKLKREIISLESNFKLNIENDVALKAKLLNLYLWLYDFIRIHKKDKTELNEIEYKIKYTSEHIYGIFKNYTNNRSLN